MSKIIRLNPTDARTWRQNISVLLDGDGAFVRNIAFIEMNEVGRIEKRARHLRQSVREEVKIGDKQVEIVSTPVHVSRETMHIRSTVDGLNVVGGRDFFRSQVLKQHGECQLRSHTGQFMCSIRDPNMIRPTAKDAMRNAPRPEACACKDWGQKHPGRHHPICEWNVKAPPDERALPEDQAGVPLLPSVVKVEKPSILTMPKKPASIPASMSRAAAPVVMAPSPETCVCKDWAGSVSGQHHSVCQFKEAWEAANGGQETMLLLNLESGEVGRRASAEEIAEARGEKGFVLIGSVQYGVISETEAKAKGAA